MLYGPDGRPLVPSRAPDPPAAQEARRPLQLPGANPSVRDVQTYGSAFTYADAALWVRSGLQRTPGRYGVVREQARQLTRELYFTPNPIFQAAVNIVAAFLVGDALSYGEITDPAVRDTVEAFWQTNAFGEYITQRFIIEFLLDGEVAMVWPQDTPEGLTARVSALDLAMTIQLDASTTRGLVASDMAERLTLDPKGKHEQVWEAGEFVWLAYNGLYNDPRGHPPTLAAANASVGYVGLINSRLRSAELLGRLLAVYKAFLDPNGRNPEGVPDGGFSSFLRKAAAFREVPEDGTVVPLIIKPGYSVTEQTPGGTTTTRYDGVSESLEFPSPAPGAQDMAADLRAVLRLVGVTLGLPEHFLGEGGNANRATASEMTLPAVKVSQRLQAYVRGFMDRVIRTELIRRHGPERLYTVYHMETAPDGLTRRRRRRRIPAHLIEIPWTLPVISQHSLEDILKVAEAAEQYGWASSQTNSASLGFDPAAEAELMAASGQSFGTSRTGGTNGQTPPSGQRPSPTSGGDADSGPDSAAGTGPAAERRTRRPRTRATSEETEAGTARGGAA